MNSEELLKENLLLKEEIGLLKEKLKKYTAPARHKNYYENHKEEILTKNKTYQISPEKKKEYARTAYLNKKEKLKKQKEQNEKYIEDNI
jgi:hypothetical protein